MDRDKKNEINALLRRLADGDRAAFDPLYAALWPIVRGFCRRALAEAPEAEDAAQITLMKIFSNASLLDPERDALPWVLGIAAYECKTLRNKKLRRKEDARDVSESLVSSEDPEAAAIARDLEVAAVAVLGTLDAIDIATLTDVMADERPAIPAATFRKRVERALRRLREAWSVHHGHD